MPDLFGIDIAGTLSDAIGDGFPSATLTKTTRGARTGGKVLSGTNPTYTDYPTSGIISGFIRKFRRGENSITTAHKVLLLGKALSDAGVEPAPEDRITIENKTYNVVAVSERDPAAATWTCYVVGV